MADESATTGDVFGDVAISASKSKRLNSKSKRLTSKSKRLTSDAKWLRKKLQDNLELLAHDSKKNASQSQQLLEMVDMMMNDEEEVEWLDLLVPLNKDIGEKREKENASKSWQLLEIVDMMVNSDVIVEMMNEDEILYMMLNGEEEVEWPDLNLKRLYELREMNKKLKDHVVELENKSAEKCKDCHFGLKMEWLVIAGSAVATIAAACVVFYLRHRKA